MKKEKKYIYIKEEKYCVTDIYVKDNREYIVYKDVKYQRHNILGKLYIMKYDKVIENGWVKLNSDQFNFYNPLTYLLLFFITPVIFVTGGIQAVKEAYKKDVLAGPILHSSVWYKKEDIKYSWK